MDSMSGTYDYSLFTKHDEEQNIKASREPSEIKVNRKKLRTRTYIQWYNGDRDLAAAAAVLKASTTLPNRQYSKS